MPAHRSEAEALIRNDVVAKLRRIRPGARIMHEVNIASGQNRVDVMAVDRAEIIMVEIKSERDKLDRLPEQVASMECSAHHVIAALDRKFMPDIDSLSRPRLEGLPYDLIYWWHPGARDMAEAHHPAFTWREPDVADSLQVALPIGALSLLWRDELAALCAELRVPAGARANMSQMCAALRWMASGREITLGICRELRRRDKCAEADPPIEEAA
ncbi:MAG: NERD domain-containing protein [Pseudomonadota bacterium]